MVTTKYNQTIMNFAKVLTYVTAAEIEVEHITEEDIAFLKDVNMLNDLSLKLRNGKVKIVEVKN